MVQGVVRVSICEDMFIILMLHGCLRYASNKTQHQTHLFIRAMMCKIDWKCSVFFMILGFKKIILLGIYLFMYELRHSYQCLVSYTVSLCFKDSDSS